MKNKILRLFFSFLKIGLFTFGGGYAMLALIEREFVEKNEWIDSDEYSSLVAIAESTPGPIAINAATYIGYKVGRFLGALLSTVAIIIPSFTIIFVISLFFDAFIELEFVGYAFKGIQVCIAYLILCAGIRMFKKMKKTALDFVLLAATVAGMLLVTVFLLRVSAVLFILAGAFVGVIFYAVGLISKKEKKK